jgi:hypothetical protein
MWGGENESITIFYTYIHTHAPTYDNGLMKSYQKGGRGILRWMHGWEVPGYLYGFIRESPYIQKHFDIFESSKIRIFLGWRSLCL